MVRGLQQERLELAACLGVDMTILANGDQDGALRQLAPYGYDWQWM